MGILKRCSILIMILSVFIINTNGCSLNKEKNINLQSLPKGELQSQVISPNGNYTLNTYLCNGGATVDFAIRGEIVFNKEKKNPKNIYLNYHEKSAEVRWIDEQAVVINGKRLNVLVDEYDWRKDKTWK